MEGLFEMLTHNCFLREGFLKCTCSWLRKQSRPCILLASPGNSRSWLQNVRDAVMPWDAGVVQPRDICRNFFSHPETWLCWAPWPALIGATLSVSPPPVQLLQPTAPYLQLPVPLPFHYFFLPPLFLSSFFFFNLVSEEFALFNQNQCLEMCGHAEPSVPSGCSFPLTFHLPASQSCKTHLRSCSCLLGFFLFTFLLRGCLDHGRVN